MGKFVIRKIVVDKACENKLKILEPGEYIFTDARYDNFFMEGVAIQAVVGKNGCGKSSLVEMLFRMSNNLAALMLRGYERPAAEKISFIQDVVGEIHYELDGMAGMLKCGNNCVSLQMGDEIFTWSLDSEDCEHRSRGILINGETRFDKEVKAAASFFYTIATNYSMQAYITDDYSGEKIQFWNEEERKWKESHETKSWIDGVFHKNDGYMSPVVLNPYREEGKIDMAKEERLTTNRLCSMLWETKDGPDDTQLINGYRLLEIGYELYNSPLMDKFDSEVLKGLPDDPISSKFIFAYTQDGSIAKDILDAYGLTVDRKMSLVEQSLRIYLAYKTLNIAGKYPSYSHFMALGDVNLIFQAKPESFYPGMIEELVGKIMDDTSHITLKVKQTLRLIEEMTKAGVGEGLRERFAYSKYIRLLGYPDRVGSLEERTELLPPPIFRANIFLIKNDVYKQLYELVQDEGRRSALLWKNAISLNHLSSGERQFIYTTSTLVYHALNLKSVPEVERIKYRNICMVLDEIEICFHPEYQRTFINNLISLIKRTRLADSFGINVIVVTHSPFVLSDIPQGNIMYLKDGHQLTRDEQREERITNPFCANINDILHQSFFLDKGFVGEFARQRVLSLVDYLKGEDNEYGWNPEKARSFIKEIGEPLIREQLLDIYRDSDVTGVQDKIAMYQDEIQRLEKEKG